MKTARIILGVLMLAFVLVVLTLGIIQDAVDHVAPDVTKELVK